MTTTEEKLLKLLKIAVNYGFNNSYVVYNYEGGYFDNMRDSYVPKTIMSSNYYFLYDQFEDEYDYLNIKDDGIISVGNWQIGSINDLICNWEKGEASFLQSLLKFDEDNEACSIRVEWILRPTSERLAWLFEKLGYLLINTSK